MPFAYVILALILLVVLHELGHFLAARWVGIRATKFYVFFPPAVFKRKVGDVEYGIGAIPAGGFVRLPGMFEPQAGEVAERLRYQLEAVQSLVDADAHLRLDAARRTIAHAERTDDIVAPLEEIRDVLAEAIATESRPEELAMLTKVRARVQDVLDDAHPEAYWRASLWSRMFVIAAGPATNLAIAFIVLTAFWWFLSPRYEVSAPLRIDAIAKESPAEAAGLTAASRITAWNGPIEGEDPYDLRDRIAAGIGKPTQIEWVDPDGDEHQKTLTPKQFDGGDDKRIGISPALGGGKKLDVTVVGRTTTDPVKAMRIATKEIRTITWGNLSRLPRVFYDKEIREDVGSVVGIVQVADDVDKAGQIVRYIAVISLILAVMNLLPLLPLDGGHLLFGMLEAIRRKPMPRVAFERYSMVGLALVLILFFIGLDNDIARARG